jgi:Rieske Fe-S protein
MDSRDSTVRVFSCEARDCSADGTNRREFLRSAGCVGATVALLGLTADNALALPVYTTNGTGDAGERRYSIPPTDSVNVDQAAQLIVVRAENHVYVFALSCPHQNNVVKWVAKDHRFQCTKHDSRYTPNGTYTSARATRNLDRYVIRRDGDSIVVDLHKWIQSDKDPAGWAAATIGI